MLDHTYLGKWHSSKMMLPHNDFLIWRTRSVGFCFFYLCFKHSEDNLNCTFRPKDLSWGQSAFSFSIVDTQKKSILCNDHPDKCISNHSKPSQQLFLRTCDKFPNPLTTTYACIQRGLPHLLSQLPCYVSTWLISYSVHALQQVGFSCSSQSWGIDARDCCTSWKSWTSAPKTPS